MAFILRAVSWRQTDRCNARDFCGLARRLGVGWTALTGFWSALAWQATSRCASYFGDSILIVNPSLICFSSAGPRGTSFSRCIGTKIW